MFKFFAKDFVPVMQEAIKNKCGIAFIKDQGVYFVSVTGKVNETDNRRKHIAYAQGCNPLTDPDWTTQSDLLAGGKGQRKAVLPTNDPMLQHIYQQQSDFEVIADQFSFFIIAK